MSGVVDVRFLLFIKYNSRFISLFSFQNEKIIQLQNSDQFMELQITTTADCRFEMVTFESFHCLSNGETLSHKIVVSFMLQMH